MGKFPRGVVWRLSVKVLLSLHSTGQFEMLSSRHSLNLLHPEAQYPSIFLLPEVWRQTRCNSLSNFSALKLLSIALPLIPKPSVPFVRHYFELQQKCFSVQTLGKLWEKSVVCLSLEQMLPLEWKGYGRFD